MSTLRSSVVSRGSQVQYVPQALAPQSGPVVRTMAPKTTATSAPARASASHASVGSREVADRAEKHAAAPRYIA